MSNKYIMLTLHDDDVSMFSFSEGKVKIEKISKTAYDKYGSPLSTSDSHYNIKAKKLKLADVELDEETKAELKDSLTEVFAEFADENGT